MQLQTSTNYQITLLASAYAYHVFNSVSRYDFLPLNATAISIVTVLHIFVKNMILDSCRILVFCNTFQRNAR